MQQLLALVALIPSWLLLLLLLVYALAPELAACFQCVHQPLQLAPAVMPAAATCHVRECPCYQRLARRQQHAHCCQLLLPALELTLHQQKQKQQQGVGCC
jgi:hypothetical protein